MRRARTHCSDCIPQFGPTKPVPDRLSATQRPDHAVASHRTLCSRPVLAKTGNVAKCKPKWALPLLPCRPLKESFSEKCTHRTAIRLVYHGIPSPAVLKHSSRTHHTQPFAVPLYIRQRTSHPEVNGQTRKFSLLSLWTAKIWSSKSFFWIFCNSWVDLDGLMRLRRQESLKTSLASLRLEISLFSCF